MTGEMLPKPGRGLGAKLLIAALGVMALLVAITLLGAIFGPADHAVRPTAVASPTNTPTSIEEAIPEEKLPNYAPPVPLTGFCVQDGCEELQKTFARRDWPKAWQGDYQGQRNAAFCRSNSCEGAVQINPVEGCAWRIVILQAHVDESDQTDTANLNIDCGKLDGTARAAAMQKAESIHQRIYNKPLPKGGVVQ